MNDEQLLDVLHRTVDAVVTALAAQDDWGLSGQRPGQYEPDLTADAAAVDVLAGAGLRVLSEESGLSEGEGPVAVLDPLDGSTNASLLLPWYATSICVVDGDIARVSVVHDHASGVRFSAIRRQGAWIDDQPLPQRSEVDLADAIVVVNALPPTHGGWAQFRCMGATALDLCAVADGRFDAYVDYDDDAIGPWDYMGALLVCGEVGIDVVDAFGRELVVTDPEARRSPVAAPGALLGPLLEHRRAKPGKTAGYVWLVTNRPYQLALRVFGRLPRSVRRTIIRSISPSWTAGAMAIIERDDGRWLMVKPAYRKGWALPGGLLDKGEHPEAGVRRELREELGLNVLITGEPWVIVDAGLRRVDVVFRSTPLPGSDPDSVTVRSAELLDAQWIDPDHPPFLEGEAQDVLVLRRRALEGGDSVLFL